MPLFPRLTPTLVLPVMPKKKLKVRRKEEPAQVPDSPSSWLLLQRDREEVRRERELEKKIDHGGGGDHAMEIGDWKKTPPRHSPGSGRSGFPGPSIYEATPDSSSFLSSWRWEGPVPLKLLSTSSGWREGPPGGISPSQNKSPVWTLCCLEKAPGPRANKNRISWDFISPSHELIPTRARRLCQLENFRITNQSLILKGAMFYTQTH